MVNRAKVRQAARILVRSSVFRNKSRNLRDRAIHVRDAHNGVIVYVDDNIAKYGDMLDKGKVPGKGQDHVGWFSVTAYTKLTTWVESDLNKRKNNVASNERTIAQNSKDTSLLRTTYLRNIRGSVR